MSVKWVPMRWPEQWNDPAKLKLIEGTPINCLIGSAPPSFDLGDIPFIRLEAGEVPDGIAVGEGLWPAVQSARDRETDTADAGPTGAPWVDSNASLVQLVQALEPGKTVWLTYDPPKEPEVTPPAAFALPIAEAEAYGARWVITLDKPFREGLENSTDEALGGWKRMMEVLSFSEQHSEWKTWQPVANLGVLSDFAGENEFLSHEFLNLAPRRHLAYRIIPLGGVAEARLDDLKAVLYISTTPPDGDLRRQLTKYVRNGGLLISPPGYPSAEPQERKFGYGIHNLGQGRIAVPAEDWSDPYLLAADIHLLLSRRHDVVRIWNGGTMNAHYVASPGGNRAVVHLVSYSHSRGLNDVTLGFAESYKKAEVYTLQGNEQVTAVKRRLGVEVPLPSFSTYAAIELRG